MSINDGGPAFPVSTMVGERTAGYGHQDGPATYQFGGMTLRDYFAAKAMQGLLAEGGSLEIGYVLPAHWPQYIAKRAVSHADALLAELAKESNQ